MPPTAVAAKDIPYNWEGKDKKGNKVRGRVLAKSENEVRAELRRQAIVPVKIRKQSQLLSSGGKIIDITSGALGANSQGTARVFLNNTQKLSNALTSPGAICTVNAAPSGNALQVKPGSMWAQFTCSSVENPPGEACSASGTFVLENCVQ